MYVLNINIEELLTEFDPATLQTLEQLLAEEPFELSEMILKHYLIIKIKEREALGWDQVHDELLIQPFCPEKQRLVHIMGCAFNIHCCSGGYCYPCYKQEKILHKPTISVPINDITLVKYCADIMDKDHISQASRIIFKILSTRFINIVSYQSFLN